MDLLFRFYISLVACVDIKRWVVRSVKLWVGGGGLWGFIAFWCGTAQSSHETTTVYRWTVFCSLDSVSLVGRNLSGPHRTLTLTRQNILGMNQSGDCGPALCPTSGSDPTGSHGWMVKYSHKQTSRPYGGIKSHVFTGKHSKTSGILAFWKSLFVL